MDTRWSSVGGTVSILDRGPHVVEVTTKVKSEGSLGTEYKSGPPVVVRNVAVQPVSAEESQELGITARTTYRIIGRGEWPGGVMSTVKILTGPTSGVFDQHGVARYYGMSGRTAHYDVFIIQRGTEAK